MKEKAEEVIEEVIKVIKPKKFKLKEGEVLVEQPGTSNHWKAKIKNMNLGLFSSKEKAQEAIILNRK